MSPGPQRTTATTDPQDVAERQRAARALMLTPLLHSEGPTAEDFRLARRHRDELARMFAEGLGYRLDVGPGAARLYKTGLGRDPSRPVRRRSGVAFTPRTYALLCLTLAALTRSRGQLLVDELVQQVRSAAVDAGVSLDLDGASDRRGLNAAFLLLVALGVLRERDGDLEHWADQRTQSLLDVRRDLLGLLVAGPIGSASGVDDLLGQAALPSAAGGARTAIRRRLLESPVMSVADLPADHAEWWGRNRNRERDWFDSRFGLRLELRAEGAVVVDPHDGFTDEAFPGADKTRQLALLVLESLVEGVRANADEAQVDADAPEPWRALTGAAANARAHEVRRRWHARLRRDQREDPDGAIREAFAVLVRFGLVRVEDDRVLVHPAASRYAASVRLAEPGPGGAASLFGDPADDD